MNMGPLTRLLARYTGPGARKGLALVVVLWVLVLLSLMVASFTRTTRTEVNLARNLVDSAQAQALADAGVHLAILNLTQALAAEREGGTVVDDFRRAMQAARLQLEDAGTEPPDEAADRVFTDGRPFRWQFAEGEIEISIQDEAGKIDLNTAPDELLRGLFMSAQWTDPDGEPTGLDADAADAVVDAVRDFADPDDLRRLNGAEDPEYEAAGLPWGAKDAPFEAIEELQQVLGVSRELYRRVTPLVTVHSGKRGIDARWAPQEALSAVPGMTPAAVESVIAARDSGDLLAPGTLQESAALFAPSDRDTFSIRTEAHTQVGAVFVREAVVRLTGDQRRSYQVRAWKQGRAAEPAAEEPVAAVESETAR